MNYAAQDTLDQDPSLVSSVYQLALAALFALSLVLAGYHIRGRVDASKKEPRSPAPPKQDFVTLI